MTNRTTDLPFRTVTAHDDGSRTHLVFHSPALPQHQASDLASRTLCWRTTAACASAPVGDVDCLLCLGMTPKYMTFPTFEEPA